MQSAEGFNHLPEGIEGLVNTRRPETGVGSMQFLQAVTDGGGQATVRDAGWTADRNESHEASGGEQGNQGGGLDEGLVGGVGRS